MQNNKRTAESNSSAVTVMVNEINPVLDIVLKGESGCAWALIGWPSHSNVGDSAIWAGSRKLLEEYFGSAPRFVAGEYECPAHLDSLMPEGPIFLVGGGNFGDLWPGVHENRLRLIKKYRHRKIIQLPQSIFFSEKVNCEETRRTIASHPDFTLLVRDRRSFEFASNNLNCATYLCPDFAFGLGKQSCVTHPDQDIFLLMRRDKEARETLKDYATLTSMGPIDDWTSNCTPLPRRLRVLRKLSSIPGRAGKIAMHHLDSAFFRYSIAEVNRGLNMLNRGRAVLTNRLHGHILCLLLDKPHVVLDNSYGKISGYIATWPKDDLTQVASSTVTATKILREPGSLKN